MAEALASSSSRNFWNEIKNVNRSCSQQPSHAPVVDGIHREENIANVFSSNISSLLSSSNSESSDSLLHQLMDHLTSKDLSSVSMSSSCIRSAFKFLKPHKADGTSLLSDLLIFALPAIEGFVPDLFTCILRHGYMPAALRYCILVPIPKGNKDPTSSDKYYPVALAPTPSKALEWSIILLYPNHFTTSDLQLGFKKGMPTTPCTGFIKNVVSKFVHNGSSVFDCFLDASKAFDLVNHDILFLKLMERGHPSNPESLSAFLV